MSEWKCIHRKSLSQMFECLFEEFIIVAGVPRSPHDSCKNLLRFTCKR